MKRTKRFTLRRIALGLAVAAIVPASAQAAPTGNQLQLGPGEIPYLSHGVGVDDSTFAVTGSPDDRPFSRASENQLQLGPGEIPYLSHGVGVSAANFDPTVAPVLGADDRNLSKATTLDVTPTRADDGWSVDLSTGLAGGMILVLAAAGAMLAILRHSRKTKLSPA